MMEPVNTRNVSLTEIAKVFLKLGTIGFGGPAVHIALMEEEVVKKRKWIEPDHFLDLVGATNLIPGPNSTEMAMHCGHEKAGRKGLVVAGLCFMVPAIIITAVIAWAYQQYGQLPEVQPLLYGIKPAIIAVILSLMISLGRKALKSVELGIIGAMAAIAVLIGFNEIYVLFGAGLISVLLYLARKNRAIPGIVPVTLLQITTLAADISNWKLFLIFLKVGAILYGSGYVLFGFLDAELVTTGLLSRSQLTDAIAVGQFTPGPVFSAATFIGWQIAGMPGALAATVGIFLPSFLFVALLNPVIPRLRQSTLMSVFLDSVNMASVAIIFAICVEMSKESIRDWRTILIAVAGLTATFVFKKLNTAFIILGGALAGYLLHLFT
jgi:chromate transporter